MKYINLIIVTLLLTSCDGSNQGPTAPGSVSGSSNSLMGSMASGVAAGMGMAAGHHIINGAVNKWKDRKAMKVMNNSYRMRKFR